jgi:integrase
LPRPRHQRPTGLCLSPKVVVDALAAHLAAFPAARVEILDATHKPDPKRRLAALVFTSATGRPLRRIRFSDVWRAAAATAGIGDGVTFHDLRHYYASLLIRHGESVKVVQKRLGHKSAVETLDTYSHLWPDSDSHLWPDSEDRTREAVDEVLGQVASRSAEEAAP